MAATSVLTATTKSPFLAPTASKATEKNKVVEDLLKIIEKEYRSGNSTITKDKYQQLLKLKQEQTRKQRQATPPLPPPLYPPIFHKFNLPNQEPPRSPHPRKFRRKSKLTFKKVEHIVISILETLANILDNLHLFSKLPMFPEKLAHLLKHTNRLWVLILVFLIRKTVSQLLNLIRKERKVKTELGILKTQTNSKLLEETEKPENENNVLRKYEKVLRDLKFDKMMLRFELLGNFLDLAFNVIELYAMAVPDWFMNFLNFASMGMTIYRMNKDDEYVDDDITDDLI